MCRNIKPLFNYEPPVSDSEIRAAAIQFVRKISGFTAPSKVNQDAFERAVDEIASASKRMIDALITSVPKRNREAEALKAKVRAQRRFATE